MENRKRNDDVIEAWKGSAASRSLSELKIDLTLIQAASLLALEGNTRATASQVAGRAFDEYGTDATPSFTGQIFASHGVRTTITHGKSRFVLVQAQLDDIRKKIEATIDERTKRLESSIDHFRDLPERIESLHETWKGIIETRTKERELTRIINESMQTPSKLRELQAKLEEIRDQEARQEELRATISELETKLKALPDLEERKTSLEGSIARYEQNKQKLAGKEQDFREREQAFDDWEQALVEKEDRLAKRIEKIRTRQKWVELAELEEAIEQTTKELDHVRRQLGEKKTLLDRIRGGITRS